MNARRHSKRPCCQRTATTVTKLPVKLGRKSSSFDSRGLMDRIIILGFLSRISVLFSSLKSREMLDRGFEVVGFSVSKI